MLKFSLFVVILAFVGCASTSDNLQKESASLVKVFPLPNDFVPISQIQITSRFNTVEVTRETLGFELNKCIPQFSADSQDVRERLKIFPNGETWGTRHVSSANIFLLYKTTAVCLHQSSEKFTIFAAEAFFYTVNPQGVPSDVLDGWYKQIALLIATKGVANVAYVGNNGDAFVVRYWIEKPLEFGLFYSSAYKKSGAWDKINFDANFYHPSMTAVSESTTKQSGLSQKMNPLSHRFR